MRATASPLSEAVMVLAALTAAMVVAGAVMYNASYLSSRLAAAGVEAGSRLSERVTVVYAFLNQSSGCHIIVLKNTGSIPLGGLNASTVILGNTSYSVILTYSSSPSSGCGCWGYREIEKPDATWEPRETIVVEACPPVNITPPYKFVMVLPTGLRVAATYTG